MPLGLPDYIKCNNANEPIIKLEEKQVKGAAIIDTISSRNGISSSLRIEGYQAYVQSTDKVYVYTSADMSQAAWDLVTNWRIVGDNNYSETFENSDTWVIYHYLNKYPTVMIVDSDNDIIEGATIVYNSVDQLTLTFLAAGTLVQVSGTAYLN